MKILIVDDELVSRAKMKKIMERYGPCDDAADGETALSMVRRSADRKAPYELITLDVDMPGMSGLQVLAELRKMEQHPQWASPMPMKIIMVTAMGDRQTLSRSLVSGCDDYIIKPFQPDTIYRQMRILGIPPSRSPSWTVSRQKQPPGSENIITCRINRR